MKIPQPEKIDSQYWQDLLDNPPPVVKIGLEEFEILRHSSSKADGSYHTYSISIEAMQIKKLNQLAERLHCSLANLLQTVWGLLLNRFSGVDDLVYGMADYTQEDDIISLNTPIFPVRSTLLDAETLMDYLKKQIHQLKISKKQAAFYSTEDIQVYFNYLFIYPAKPSTDTQQKILADPKIYSLILRMQPSNIDTFSLDFLYFIEKFSAASMQQLADHFLLILEKMLGDSDQFVMHFSMLTSQEQKEIFTEWNNTKHNWGTPADECVHDLFSQQVKIARLHTAIVHNATSITYQQLEETSNQFAQLLLNKKVRPGDTVAVLVERTPVLIAIMLAIFKVGGIYVPIDPKYSDERIQFILDDCKTHLILTNNTQRLPTEFLYKSLLLDAKLSAIKFFPKHAPILNLSHSNRIAYVAYTSGTSEEPKGVMITHASLMNLIYFYKMTYNIRTNDRASQFSSAGFDSFFCETLPFLAVGACIHIIDDHAKFIPSVLLSWIAHQKITICELPTTYAQSLLNMPWPENISLRTLKVGGERLTNYPTHIFPFDIWNTYGPTEGTVESLHCRIFRANTPMENQPCQHVPPPIGKPIANSQVYIVDQHLEPVPVGCIGEILISGANIAVGYLNRPQLTRDRFIRHLFNNDPQARLYRTGDMGRWLPDGMVEFMGRKENQIRINGYQVELNAIEAALNQYPDVNELIILSKERADGQKDLAAYLVPNLEKIRIPYQTRCLINLNNIRFLQVLSDDISKEGIAISGDTEDLIVDQQLQINLKLPGFNESHSLSGQVVWKKEHRAGIKFEPTARQKSLMHQSIANYFATHNLMETIQSAAAKRNLQNALKNKLPTHLIPATFNIVPQFPLTFNGKIDSRALPAPQDFSKLLEKSYVAPRNTTEKIIANIWCELLHIEHVSMTDNFFDYGATSATVAQLAIKLVDNFNVSIPESVFLNTPFIPSLAEYIDSNGQKNISMELLKKQIFHDATLRDDLLPNKNTSDHLKTPKAILLTGSTGFLGIYLLRELLKNTNATIYCLIRKGNFTSVAARLTNHIERYELSDEISLNERRIILISGDIALDQFGIAGELYHTLAEKVEVIYHCAARHNLMTSYENLRPKNIQGTLEVIRFALQKFNKPIHFVSSLDAVKQMDNDLIAENFPGTHFNSLLNNYAISKWIGERLLTQIKNRHLPVSIYRLGYISGQSENGITQMDELFLALLKGCIQLGMAPEWHYQINLLPVDFISRAIVGISLTKAGRSQAYNLTAPQPINWHELITWLNDYGYPIRFCNHLEWLHKLTEIPKENAMYSYLPHLLAQITEPQNMTIETAKTQATLLEAHLTYPEINQSLLRTYFNYLCQVGFLPPPGKKTRVIS